MAELAIGQTLGQYLLVGELGRGGMAIVYKARQTSPDRFVALKVLSPELAVDPEFISRFRHEANIAAMVDHPNVVPIYAVGEDRGFFFIAMRLVPGDTLATIIRREGPLSLDRTRRILWSVADALDYAHHQGVIHRDLKPSNIMIEAGDRVTLTDFGIARARDETVVARTQGVIGTPHYMAPEQALGETIDYRADLYALGIIAYEMLTGKVPFQADTPLAVLHRQVYDATPSIRAERPDLPPELDAAISRMLAKKPEERFPSASAFVSAIDDGNHPTLPRSTISDSPTVRITPSSTAGDAHQADERHRLRALVFAIAVVALALVAAIPTIGPRLIAGGAPTAQPAQTPIGPSPAASVTARPTDARPDTPVPSTPSPLPSPTNAPSPAGSAGEVPSATPKPALPGGTIVFVSERSDDRNLYAVSPTGQDLRRLPSGEAHNPACSPTGETVAFESNRSGVTRIYLQRLSDSGAPEPVTSGSANDQLAAWNPSGRSIAFARAQPNNTAIFTIDLASHQERRLTSGEGGDWRMSYSPDGQRIAFTSTRSGNNEIWIMRADGTGALQLTSGPGDKRDPAWSPDGQWIAFRSDRDGHHWDLYRVSPTSGQIVRLTSDAADKGFPNWSPDSRWILFTSNRSGKAEVYVMPVEGGEWIPITSAPTIGGGATWCR